MMKLEDLIIAEIDDYLVINKPARILTHGDGKNEEASIADLVLSYFPAINKVVNTNPDDDGEDDQASPIRRRGIVHRLDRDTSGVLVIAKNQAMFDLLKEQFQKKTIFKEYNAFVYGSITRDNGSIDFPIGRQRGRVEKFSTPPRATINLKPALTYYELQDKFQYQEKWFSLVKCVPKTGRTHQIRVHLQAIGHPIVMDKLYASPKQIAGDLGFSRQALHARLLRFTDLSGKSVEFIADFPADFKEAISLM